ncbi:Rieske (2Fe-2S) protein [Micromonospora rifamycinica]|uniref:Rieske (2Fe-2S) protein n=1 Tax=Micromonospora rifamycinica TaxID=291594 RepID=UPI002E2B6C19|nr:Rieske (2Fe-2S) protein [Micromonospora rifamycinica]
MCDERGAGCPSRRTVLAGAGGVGVAALLSGCQTYGESTAPTAAGQSGAPAAASPGGATSDGASPGGAGPSTGASGSPAGGGEQPPAPAALAAVADIPVGGGKIFKAEGVVVTQPAAGTIKAFSATCTHQGCTVTSVKDGTIVCGCHNSVFGIADGAVQSGPAGRPLTPRAVTVDGDDVRLA